MRLERLDYDKIKIFLSFEDLRERGISKEEIWMDVPKVEELFREMIREANEELGFQPDGPVVVEVFSLPVQGMVVIVTKAPEDTLEDDWFDEDFIELKINFTETDAMIFKFDDIEDVIQLAHRLHCTKINLAHLYRLNDAYYIHISQDDVERESDGLLVLMAEYGERTSTTIHRLEEYGSLIIEGRAFEQLRSYFPQ
ncbi:genetic competence negative regulator [Texcoconibacillus texcoconensis]|uniref:Adapter protein MecA n=1 Tax=Texcoconibacillus texcoconensis TaxID=1095777 RepID=A0A840QNK6_9BACI|nr:genetic competence negative regulator [Texcoconibacillus texcoconensis]MBB5172921.1 adapter protein MecA 1/2 [Texcoconibacillus texcoconensis]